MSQEPNLIEAEKDDSLGRRLGSSGTLLVLFYDHWFAVISLGILLSGILFGLFLPRIWRQTPDGFTPVVKVSGLDLWQARSLRRAANRHLEGGRFNEAVIAWSSAIANNLGDTEVIREALRALVAQPRVSQEHLGFGVGRAFWLLRLGKTNIADLELTLDVLGRYSLDNYVLVVGGPYRDQLSSAGKMRIERAYFDLGKKRDFGEFWDKNAALFEKDPEMMIYRNAWVVTVGNVGNPFAAQEALNSARNDPAHRILANRLQLSVSFARQDLETFADAMRQLEDEHADQLGHHVYQWLLLFSSGRQEEARELARNYSHPPATPSEVSFAAEGFHRIGLADNAIAYLEQHIRRFSFEPELWLLEGTYLMEAKRWTDLRALALAIRNDPSLQSQLDAYSYFAEAIAEGRLDRPEAASNAASRITRSAIPSQSLAREMARTLRTEGFAKIAVDILRPLKESLKDSSEFWFEYTVAAFSANSDEDILPASQRALELLPNDLSAANNHAAALIAFRSRPDEAIKLTLRVVSGRPGDNGSLLNHVLALLQNGREADAEKLLRGMNTLNLGPAGTSVYYLCWFELNTRRKEWAEARASYGRIDPHQLLNVQARWLDETFRAIPRGS